MSHTSHHYWYVTYVTSLPDSYVTSLNTLLQIEKIVHLKFSEAIFVQQIELRWNYHENVVVVRLIAVCGGILF